MTIHLATERGGSGRGSVKQHNVAEINNKNPKEWQISAPFSVD